MTPCGEIQKSTTPTQSHWMVNHWKVEAFTYLGSVIDKQGDTDADVKARIRKARAAFMPLRNV